MPTHIPKPSRQGAENSTINTLEEAEKMSGIRSDAEVLALTSALKSCIAQLYSLNLELPSWGENNEKITNESLKAFAHLFTPDPPSTSYPLRSLRVNLYKWGCVNSKLDDEGL